MSLTKKQQPCPNCENTSDWYAIQGTDYYRCHGCNTTVTKPKGKAKK